ncbi:MAG: response regulator [Verrucomicrobia bacterium]|nr:response regulator [Verrucomicrobiota bacterium]
MLRGGGVVPTDKATEAARASVQGPAQSASVLVVDDSRTLRRLLIRELNEIGITHITEATDGREALDLVHSKDFDLVLLDMEMPELDGLQVLYAIKADPLIRSLPVIVISGAEQFDQAVKCIEMGAEDYLPKPFNAVLLRARVMSSLEKKRLRDLDRLRLTELQYEKELLQLEKEKSERLLLNILPHPIAERLKRGERTIADSHAEVTVLFADLVGFTQLSSKTEPHDLVNLLNEVFTHFDHLAERHGLEKIKTIGDNYMLVGGLPLPRGDHADAVAAMALEMIEDVARINEKNQRQISIRIGINTGPVVAGVIGRKKFTYDLWGDTVNLASRMESSGLPNSIHVSPSTRAALTGKFTLTERGLVLCKGVGEITTWFLTGRK